MANKTVMQIIITLTGACVIIWGALSHNRYSEHQSDVCDVTVTSSSSGFWSGFATSDVSQKERAALNASLTVDDDDDDDSDWGEDEWPLELPLPLPEWGCERPEVRFVSLAHYHKFLWSATEHLRDVLTSQPYDSISNFIWFAREYQNSRNNHPDLREFYRDYDPPMVPGHYTCVGLAADLASRLANLENSYPGLKDATYQVSCDEDSRVEDYANFREPPSSQSLKEHVMLCVRMRLNHRHGVILFDPGYHMAQPITLMEDGAFPQSGVLRGSTTREDVERLYRYRYVPHNNAFVEWKVDEIRDGVLYKNYSNMIHVTRPFLSGVDIAERRVLIYRFKTLLGRNADGKLTCGIYLPVRNVNKTNVTFFHEANGRMKHYKKPLSYFLDEKAVFERTNSSMVDEEVEEAITAVAKGTARRSQEVRGALVNLAQLLCDEDLLREVVELDEAIDNI